MVEGEPIGVLVYHVAQKSKNQKRVGAIRCSLTLLFLLDKGAWHCLAMGPRDHRLGAPDGIRFCFGFGAAGAADPAGICPNDVSSSWRCDNS